MHRSFVGPSFLLSVMALFGSGCSQVSSSPTHASSVPLGQTSQSESRSSERCINVTFDTTAALGFREVAPGVFKLGALPVPVTLGAIPGLMGSIVTTQELSGANGQGAQHLTLQHTFESTDSLRPGGFLTEDKAVCAPNDPDPYVCRVNDDLRLVSGTGIFLNASGSLRNHGVIDLNHFTVSISLNGRVCGDGV